MDQETIWLECRMKGTEEVCCFPGRSIQQATAKAIKFFKAISIPFEDVDAKKYTPEVEILAD